MQNAAAIPFAQIPQVIGLDQPVEMDIGIEGIRGLFDEIEPPIEDALQ